MSLHSLFGHRSLVSLCEKRIDVGDIVGHEKYTNGVDFRKKSMRQDMRPMSAGQRPKQTPQCEQAECEAYPPDQQQQRFKEEHAASKKGQDMSKSALNFMHKHEGRQPSKNMSTLAYQSIDELTDMKPMQRGTSGRTDIRHVLISTCETTGYRQVHGLVDLTQESLLGALGKVIAFAKANECELIACKFDPSGQACAKEVQSFLDLHTIHHETTASGTKQEMPVAEQSNATFSQGARANLASVQITSQDGGGGGGDKRWRDALFFLAGCEAIRMTNCTHHSGAKRVPEAVLTVDRALHESQQDGHGNVRMRTDIVRRQHPKNKTQLKGEIGLFGGAVGSVLGQVRNRSYAWLSQGSTATPREGTTSHQRARL
jgi:hypothetical protein